MNAKPILFSGPMVRAILEGRKRETRRLMKPQPEVIPDDVPKVKSDTDFWWACNKCKTMIQMKQVPQFCPYGRRGDLLWVRETWQYKAQKYCTCTQYASDPSPCDEWIDGTGCASNRSGFVYITDGEDQLKKWKPSIFMPRAASRITLEVVNVRAEPLLEITESDALAEGFNSRQDFLDYFYKLNPKLENKNPWVWVIKFKRVEQ